MKLSIVIVNYNVRYFLDQCLRSIELAQKPAECETIVVDNASTDDSIQMIEAKYPDVTLLKNRDNKGFSVACNQGMKVYSGEFLLFLNPDTILKEDSLSTPLKYMEENPKTGALGVKMLDGSGNFLPESKRGLPTPFVAFCKASGLSGLFPRSKLFNRYYLGHLPSDQNAIIDVLCGAYMMVRRSAIEAAGGAFDEEFFMYGEDIDLSYRIKKAGFDVFYMADTSIIHFKGESTKKTSLNYIKTFHKAMEIFAEKHFSRSGRFYKLILRTGIYIKAILSLLIAFFTGKGLMLIDFATIYLGALGIQYVLSLGLHGIPDYYPDSLLYFNLPLYSAVFIFFLYLNGFYSKFRNIAQTLAAILFGGLVLLAVYGLLDPYFRSSRAVLLATGIWVLLYAVFSRIFFNMLRSGNLSFSVDKDRSVALIGGKKPIVQALEILQHNEYKAGIIIPLSLDAEDDPFFKGSAKDLTEVAHAYKCDEVIFCGPDIGFNQMMAWMDQLGPKMRYRILTPEGDSLISSYSSSRSGELFTMQINHRLSMPHIRLQKRLFDLLLNTISIPALLLMALVLRKRGKFLRDWLAVWLGRKTWAGYHPSGKERSGKAKLPPACTWQSLGREPSEEMVEKYNYTYSMDYHWRNDLEIIVNNFARLYHSKK